MRFKSVNDLENYRKKISASKDKSGVVISVCCGTGCSASNAGEVFAGLKEALKKNKLDGEVKALSTGCHGFCERGPLVVIWATHNATGNVADGPEGIFYQQVKPQDVDEIISETIVKKKIIERLQYVDSATKQKVLKEEDVPFYKHQSRLIFGGNGKIDPTNIDDYINLGGYRALAKAFAASPETIITEIKNSGLRGRGGAGFTTGKKWELCRQASSKLSVQSSKQNQDVNSELRTPKSELKYIICNADEGDPGAFMDRSLLEGNPHSVVEGIIIGAYAITSKTPYKPLGFVYVRNEYPLAVKHLGIAIEQARKSGLLGENILGTGFSFDINIIRGAGAFVCGEETALIASIEGEIGEARPRPPYPAEKGLWGKPTNINNVKTWASVPLIINNGAGWYSGIGTKTSKGTMIFSLVGKINNTGLIEVPMGITLRDIIFKIGGGIPKGKKFKAVQTGGPSGGCIPESLLDIEIDYESLKNAGSMMGSGGMIVMDEDTCMLDVAKYFLSFTMDESCGKCTPCREGIKHMHEIIDRITKGEGKSEDMANLYEIAGLIKDTSLCALGGTAPNPVLTTMKYFREEYEAHIKEKKCPAKVCKALIRYEILKDKCNGCHLCFKNCPSEAINGEAKKTHEVIQEKCIKCGACFDVCRFDAVKVM